jgi:hypothetical protein
MWSEVMWSVVKLSELAGFMLSNFVLKWSDVKCSEVEWIGGICVK